MGELTALAPSTMKIKVVAPPERKFSVDRGFYPFLFEHFPADVDFEGRVRRVWPYHRPQEVLLRRQTYSCCVEWGSAPRFTVAVLSPDMVGLVDQCDAFATL